jgi:hypothetical protein
MARLCAWLHVDPLLALEILLIRVALCAVAIAQLAIRSESSESAGGMDAVAEIVEQTVASPRFAAYHEAYAERLWDQCQSSGYAQQSVARISGRPYCAVRIFMHVKVVVSHVAVLESQQSLAAVLLYLQGIETSFRNFYEVLADI